MRGVQYGYFSADRAPAEQKIIIIFVQQDCGEAGNIIAYINGREMRFRMQSDTSLRA